MWEGHVAPNPFFGGSCPPGRTLAAIKWGGRAGGKARKPLEPQRLSDGIYLYRNTG